MLFIIEEKPICRVAFGDALRSAGYEGAIESVSALADLGDRLVRTSDARLVVDLFSANYDFQQLRRALTQAPHAQTLVLDDRLNPRFAQMAREAGAIGYAAKDYDLDRLRDALKDFVAGRECFPVHARAVVPVTRSLRSPAGLSQRQLEVLKHVAVGKTNREIATALGITPGTVKLHIHSVLRLIGARNRTEAALVAGRFLTPNVPE